MSLTSRILAVLLAAWLVSPVLYAGHVDPYTANLSSLAMHLGPDAPATVCPDFVLKGEFLYETRIGVIGLLHLLGLVTGEFGSTAFHGVMVVSFLVFALATLAFARRFTEISSWTCACALLLIPAAIETAFFFNDNVPSCALAFSGLALVAWRRAIWAYLVAGVLLGAAITCRLDAVFVAPMIAGVAWLTVDRAPAGLLPRALASIASTTGTVVLINLLTGTSILDSIEVASIFAKQVRRWQYYPFSVLFLTLGIPGWALLTLGSLLSLFRRGVVFNLVFVAYPLLATLYFGLNHSAEIRHFYPLVIPLVLTHMTVALDWVVSNIRNRGRFRWPVTVATALAVALMATPPTWPADNLWLKDGPRTKVTGRLWSPLLWFRWQSAQRTSFAEAQALARDLADSRQSTVFTSFLGMDIAFLRLALFEDGYQSVPVRLAWPSCPESAVMVFQKPGSRVAVVRSDSQYLLLRGERTLNGEQGYSLRNNETQPLFLKMALSCDALWESDRFELIMMGRPDLMSGSEPLTGVFEPLNGRFPDLTDLRTSVEPTLDNLLSSPFVNRPADANTSVFAQEESFHSWTLERSELRTIQKLAETLAPKNYGYPELQRDMASIK